LSVLNFLAIIFIIQLIVIEFIFLLFLIFMFILINFVTNSLIIYLQFDNDLIITVILLDLVDIIAIINELVVQLNHILIFLLDSNLY